MKKLLYVSVCALFLAVALCACKKVEQPGSIQGSITDKATGEPIKTAGVELLPNGLKTITGSEGQFEFTDIEPGIYKLHITKTGYEEFMSNEIVVKSNKVTRYTVTLYPAYY
ncbi:MAG: carboxypeptidase-like regulatory domain-containing protein [Bacteroidales bacterium]|nr:carboxypeptidase-like regulatory domain-containing protein [Bacteroidales bacterium]